MNATPVSDLPSRSSKPVAKLRFWLVEIFIGLILALISLRALLPSLLERGAAFGSRYYLGLPARIDQAELSLLNGSIALTGLTVGNKPDSVKPMDAALHPPAIPPSAALIHFERISVNFSWQALFKKTVRLTRIILETPSVQLTREADGLIDPLRRAKPAKPAEASVKKETALEKSTNKPWIIEINHFLLQNPKVVLTEGVSGRDLMEFSLERFGLDDLKVQGDDLAFGAVAIQGPVLRVQRDLVAAKPASSSKPQSQKSSVAKDTPAETRQAGIRIKKIGIERAKFTWVGHESLLDVMLTLKASELTAVQGKRFPMDLALRIQDGDLRLTGEVGILPPTFKGKFTWSGLPFPPLLLASQPELAQWLHSANSSGDLALDIDVAGSHGPAALRFSGQTTIDSLALSDPEEKEVALGWKELHLVMNEILIPLPGIAKSPAPTKAHFDRIRLVEPKIRYTQPSPALKLLLGGGSNNASAKEPGAPAPQSSQPPKNASSPVEASINSLEIVGGEVEFRDTTVSPATTSIARDLSITAHSVHYPNPAAERIAIRATLPEQSSLAIDGSLKPGNLGEYIVSLKALDLPVFSPYAKAAGASLDAGQLSLETKLQTNGALIQAENDLVLKQFGISLRDPSSFTREFAMPIDFVITLLSDASDEIHLTIPLRIDQVGATVSAGTVIGSALKAALIGAVSAPLKLLGGVFEAGSTAKLSVAPLPCTNGTAELTPEAAGRIEPLVKLLADRPSMNLVLRGRASLEEQPILAEQILTERIGAGQGLPKLDHAGILERHRIAQVFAKRSKGLDAVIEPKDQPLFERYLAAVGIGADRLDALANKRAEKVRENLVSKGINIKRITIGPREATGPAGVLISFPSAPSSKGTSNKPSRG